MICNDGPELPVCGKSSPQTAAASRAKHHTERMRIMNKNFMKKTMAAMTAFLTMTALIVPGCASAADTNYSNDGYAYLLTPTSETAQIPVKKDIVLFNSEGLQVHEPNIVYSYQITSANVENATVTPKNPDYNPEDPESQLLGTPVHVMPGVIKAVTAIADSGNANAVMAGAEAEPKTGTITFGGNTELKYSNKVALNADTGSYLVIDNHKFTNFMTLSVNASKIYEASKAPGVYRYKISDVTTDATYAAAGVTEGTADDDLYLDVYVKNNDNVPSDGFVIYGYVLLKGTDGDDTSITYTTEEKISEAKTDGYVTTSEGDDNGDGEVIPRDLKSDRYMTYNVNIGVEASGDLADRNHSFPLRIELSSTTIKNMVNFDVNDNTNRQMTNLDGNGEWDSSTVNLNNIVFSRKAGQNFNIIGLPAGVEVKVTETNDTDDTYGISVKCNDIAKSMMKNGETDQTGISIKAGHNDTAEMVAFHAIVLTNMADTVIITNTRTDVSVTGIAMDIAPFIFMTCAGVILLAVFLRSRRKKDDGNRI